MKIKSSILIGIVITFAVNGNVIAGYHPGLHSEGSPSVYFPFVSGPSGPLINGCPVFPANNIWNARVDQLPVDAASQAYINTIGAATHLHPDFGTLWNGAPNGIPFATVTASQAFVPIHFYPYGSESDPGPYPIPPYAPIEGGPSAPTDSDRHVLVVDSGNCTLYELYQGSLNTDGSWNASSGAVFDLRSNTLRQLGWTSADAAGLPIFAGLVRYDEVASGFVQHAIRFTVPQTRNTYVWPATHIASSLTGANYPPMGQRFRLKASVDISPYPPMVRTIFQAFKTYGIIIADNGSSWYISGAPDSRWNDVMLISNFNKVHGSDFEAVNVTSLELSPTSGQVK
jgi:hypothetical protein